MLTWYTSYFSGGETVPVEMLVIQYFFSERIEKEMTVKGNRVGSKFFVSSA